MAKRGSRSRSASASAASGGSSTVTARCRLVASARAGVIPGAMAGQAGRRQQPLLGAEVALELHNEVTGGSSEPAARARARKGRPREANLTNLD